MTTISDKTQKIFELLRADGDYASDDEAYAEADKRAKQHERNNQALALALSEDSPSSLNDLISFLDLQKAPKKKWWEPKNKGKGTQEETASPEGSAVSVENLKGVRQVGKANRLDKKNTVNVLRPKPKSKSFKHYGNPFILPKNYTDAQVTESVNNYLSWLNGDIEAPAGISWDTNKQRDYILDSIDKGNLDGKKLLYYTDAHAKKGLQSHADALAEFVNTRRNLAATPKSPPTIVEESTQTSEAINSGNLELTASGSYPNRTIKNVQLSDATIGFEFARTAGMRATKKAADANDKPYLSLGIKDFEEGKELGDDTIEKITSFLNEHNVTSLNIAGNDISVDGMPSQSAVDDLVLDTFTRVMSKPELGQEIQEFRSGGQTGFDEAAGRAGLTLKIPKVSILYPKNYLHRNVKGKDISATREEIAAVYNVDIKDSGEFTKPTPTDTDTPPSKTTVVDPQTPEEIERIRERTGKDKGLDINLNSPLAYVKAYAEDLEETRDLIPNLNSNQYYYPHLDTFSEVKGYLEKTTTTGRGRNKKKDVDTNYGRKADATNSIYKQLNKLRDLERIERDFQSHRDSKKSNFNIYNWVSEMPVYNEEIKTRVDDAIWTRFAQGDRITDSDIAEVHSSIQESRQNAAKQLTENLRGISLRDDVPGKKTWRNKIPNANNRYGEATARIFRQNVGGKRKNRRQLAKEQAELLAFGDKKLDIIGLTSIMNNSLPEDPTSEAYRRLVNIWRLSDKFNLDTFNQVMQQAGGSPDKEVGITFSDEIRDYLQSLPSSVQKRINAEFLENPSKYSTDESFQKLIVTSVESHERIIQRDKDGARKQMGFFKDWELPVGAKRKEIARTPTETDDLEDGQISPVDADLIDPEAEGDVSLEEYQARQDTPPATGVDQEADDIETYQVIDPSDEDIWAENAYGEHINIDEIYNINYNSEGIERDNLPTVVPEGHTYAGHLEDKFKSDLENIANELYTLTEKRRRIKSAKENYPSVADVYLSDNIAKAYLGVEGHPEIKKNTPITFKVRTRTEDGAKQVTELAKTLPKKIGGHKISIKSHTGDSPEANKDTYQLLFWNDSIISDMGDMGTKNVAKKYRGDPFGAEPRSPRFETLNDETLATSLPTLRDENRLKIDSVNYKPTEQDARRLIDLLPIYSDKYDKIKNDWNKMSVGIDLDADGNPILDEQGKPTSAGTAMQEAQAKRDEFTGEGLKIDAAENARSYLDNALNSARERYMHGRVFSSKSKEYKMMKKLGAVGKGQLAPETNYNGNPDLIRVKGLVDALDLIRGVREADVQAIMTGVDSKGKKIRRNKGLKHDFDKNGNSLGIPEIVKNILLRNSDSPDDEPDASPEWEIVGHLLPDWKDWPSFIAGQMQSPDDLESTHWKVFNTDNGTLNIGHWDDVTHSKEQIVRSWDWDIHQIISSTGELAKGHNTSVATVPGEKIANDWGLEQISHRPGVGLDLVSAVSGKDHDQTQFYNRLRKLSPKEFQLFRGRYDSTARIWSKGKSGPYQVVINSLLRNVSGTQIDDEGNTTLEYEDMSRSNIPLRTSYSFDTPSIYETLSDEYGEGAKLLFSDYGKLLEYALSLTDAYREARESGETNIVLNNLDVDKPTQFVDGVEIPLLSDDDLLDFGKEWMDKYIYVGKSESERLRRSKEISRFELGINNLELNSPFFPMVENKRKFKSLAAYERHTSDMNHDLPESFFIHKRNTLTELKQHVTDNYPKYLEVANSLGFDKDTTTTPVRSLFHALNLMRTNEKGEPDKFAVSPLAAGSGDYATMRLLREKFNGFAPSVTTTDTDEEGKMTSSTEGKDSSLTVLAEDNDGNLHSRRLTIDVANPDKEVNKTLKTIRSDYIGTMEGKSIALSPITKESMEMNQLGIAVDATHEEIQKEIADVRWLYTEHAEVLKSASQEVLKEELENHNYETVEDYLKALHLYEYNLRRLDSGLIEIPQEAYKDKRWWQLGRKDKAEHFETARMLQGNDSFLNRTKLITGIKNTYDSVDSIVSDSSLYSQAEYERRYLEELGRSIGNPNTAEAVLAQAFKYMHDIRERVRDSSRDDFVALDNPEEDANNSINVMLNQLGSVWFRYDPNYLRAAEYYNAQRKQSDWWDKPLTDKEPLIIPPSRGDYGGGAEVNVAERGILLNMEAPTPMNHKNLLFNPSELLVKANFGEKLQIVPNTPDSSDIYDANTGKVVGYMQREKEGGWATYTDKGELVFSPVAGGMSKADTEKAIRNTPKNAENYQITLENEALSVEKVPLPAEDGGLPSNKQEILKWMSGNVYNQMTKNEWSEDVLRTIFEQINAERAEKGQNPLGKLSITHLGEDSYNIPQRIKDFIDNEEQTNIEKENPALIPMSTKVQNNKMIKNVRTNLRGVSTKFGVPIADVFFAREAIEGEHNKDVALPAWQKLEVFMKEQGFMGKDESLFKTLSDGSLSLNATQLQKSAKFIRPIITGHSSLSDEQNEAAQTFLSDTLGLELSEDYLSNRKDYRERTLEVTPPDESADAKVAGERTVQETLEELNRLAVEAHEEHVRLMEKQKEYGGGVKPNEIYYPIQHEGFAEAIPQIMGKMVRGQELTTDELSVWDKYKQQMDNPTNRAMELGRQQIDIVEEAAAAAAKPAEVTESAGDIVTEPEQLGLFDTETKEEINRDRIVPPRFSRGAVNELKAAGLPIPDDVIERMQVSKPADPRNEGAYMNEMYIALPADEGEAVTFNDNFLGLGDAGRDDLIELFINLLTGEAKHNYPFDDRPIKQKEEGKPLEGRLTKPSVRSPEGFQGENIWASEFTTDDAKAFIESVLKGDLETAANYFHIEPIVDEKGLENLQNIQEGLPEVTKPTGVPEGTPVEVDLLSGKAFTDSYGRAYAIPQVETIPTGETIKRGKNKGAEKTVTQLTLLDGTGNPLDTEVINALFGGLLDENGVMLDGVTDKDLAAKIAALSTDEKEVMRRESLSERQRQEELILEAEGDRWGKNYMETYVNSPITDKLDSTTIRGFMHELGNLSTTEMTNKVKDAKKKMETTKGTGKSREEYESEYKNAYNKKHKVDVSQAMLDTMSDTELMSETKKIQVEKVKAEELKAINDYREAANNIDYLNPPVNRHPEVIKQYARRVLRHQQMYDNGEMEAVDDKGEKYLTPETRAQLEAHIRILQQNYPQELEEVQLEIEELGEELTEAGMPPITNKIEEADKQVNEIMEEHRDYDNYIKTNANASLIGEHGKVLFGQTSEGTPVRLNYDGRGIPQVDTSQANVVASDLQAPHMRGLSSETQDLWNEYHKLKVASKDNSSLLGFVEAEEALQSNGLEGLNEFKSELERQFALVLDRAESPQERKDREIQNISPLKTIRDYMTSLGAFSPSYWKGKEAPPLIDDEALREITNRYNGIPKSVADALINDAINVANNAANNFAVSLEVPPEIVEFISQFNNKIFNDSVRVPATTEWQTESGLQSSIDAYYVSPQNLSGLGQQLQKELEKINVDLESGALSGGGAELMRRNDLLNQQQKLESVLNLIDTEWKPKSRAAFNSHIKTDVNGFDYVDSAMDEMILRNQDVEMVRSGRYSELDQMRTYSEQADAMLPTLIQSLKEDGIGDASIEAAVNSLGSTSMERLLEDVDVDTGLPLDEAGNMIQPPAEGLLYSPVLHAWINPVMARHIFGDLRSDRDMYINNYMELRNQAEGVDPESPEAQVFTPVTGTKRESPLSKQKSLVLHSKYGWIPLSDGNQVREKGELFSATDLVSSALTHAIQEDKEKNPVNYGTGVNPQDEYTIAGLNIDDSFNISSNNPSELPKQVVNKIAPEQPGTFERGGVAARFLGELRDQPEEVSRQASLGHQLLMGTKSFLDTPFGIKSMGLGFIVPTNESMRFTEEVYQEMTQQAKIRDMYQAKLHDISEQRTPKEERLQFKNGNRSITVDQLQMQLQNVARERMQEGKPPLTREDINNFMATNFSEEELNKPIVSRLQIPIASDISTPSSAATAVDRLTEFAGKQFPEAPPTPQEVYEQKVKSAYDEKTKAEGHQRRLEAAAPPTYEQQIAEADAKLKRDEQFEAQKKRVEAAGINIPEVN